MSTRIVTLFGEEIVPEPQKPAAKSRGKKSEQNAATEENTAEDPEAPEAAEQPVAEAAPISAPETAAPVAEEEEPVAEVQHESVDIIDNGVEEIAAETEATTPEAPAEPANTKKSRKRKDEDGMVAKPDADIIPEDWSGEKKYYTIGEVAGFFKVATSHIRFWTNEFKLKVRTTRKGDRLYTPDQVKELRAIYHLVKERGFTLSGARTKLKEQNKRDVKTVDLKTSLQDLRARLVKLRDQLT